MIDAPDIPIAIDHARRLLDAARSGADKPDGYVIFDAAGEQVASDWTGKV
jgi:hypothetical protein